MVPVVAELASLNRPQAESTDVAAHALLEDGAEVDIPPVLSGSCAQLLGMVDRYADHVCHAFRAPHIRRVNVLSPLVVPSVRCSLPPQLL